MNWGEALNMLSLQTLRMAPECGSAGEEYLRYDWEWSPLLEQLIPR